MKLYLYKFILIIFTINGISINAMEQKKNIIKKTVIHNHEKIVILKKQKSPGKELKIIHTTYQLTKEQTWTAYLTISLSTGYRAHYKFDPETARQKWQKLNN